MKLRVSIIHFVSFLALTWGYLPSRPFYNNNNVFKASSCTSLRMARRDSDSQENTRENTGRRRFMVEAAKAVSTVVGVGGLVLASPESSFAATNTQKMTQQPQVPRNKRVGGLVTKIRNIGNVMVRL
jgi:hypothetical protein